MFRAPAPLPFYIVRATRANQLYGLDAPDQVVFKGFGPIFGLGLEINPNTPNWDGVLPCKTITHASRLFR